MARRLPTLGAILALSGLLLLLLTGSESAARGGGGTKKRTGMPDEKTDRESGAESLCEVKTVTVSTLPVLRENEFSFTGGGSGSVAGGGGGGGGGGAGGESRLLLLVKTDLPGRIAVLDDLDNTALPYFTLGKVHSWAVLAL
ncbi:hypothetical protein AAFF_G00253580 [Aldrovandia affinis]|uniref:Astrotactin-2 n=1 Tax=Aldrovandia affinis TaxID=143900 RepID=A0AAD7SV08_9TELE|nr:hypothetical protein AAFF_G00253580 [Aldrovandia affinis]